MTSFFLALTLALSTLTINPSGVTLQERILPPQGCVRLKTTSNSYGQFLRSQSLKPHDSQVHLYNGELKHNQSAHVAILNIDVGNRDLQQCADAVMRIRAEYLYHSKNYDKIHFNFLSDGKPRYYTEKADASYSRKSFRSYMNYIFAFANTRSLKNELLRVKFSDMKIGDVLIQSGNPYGHAVTIMDIAINEQTGKKYYLLAQSYMPAQDIHILKNPSNSSLSPWYELDANTYTIETPEWNFTTDDLSRFKEE